jgi:drug/metabolite transporter (DMT)-like permease
MPTYRRWLPALALIVLSLTWGYTWVLAKHGLVYAPPFAFAAERCVGAVPLVLLALLVPERATAWTPSYFGMLAFMSIASTAICCWLWLYILDRVPAWEASLSVLGTPVVAILSSRLTFDEQFKTSEVAGILLIGGGLALRSLLSWAASRRSPLAVGAAKPIQELA